MSKHASVHYLFAAVQNVRNNLSDTPATLVMIHNDVQVNECVMINTRSHVDMLTCTFIVLTSLLCSAVIAAF